VKVLFVTNMYPEDARSYYGIFIHELRRSLERLEVEVEVAFTDGRRSARSYATKLPSLRRSLSTDFDLVHAHHTYCVAQTVLAGVGLERKPLLLTLHEGEIFAPKSAGHTRRRVLRTIGGNVRFKRWWAGRADGLVAVEGRLRRAMAFPGPSWTIPPGVDIDLFSPRPAAASRQTLGLDDSATIAFFPARQTYAKGYDLFDDALRLLSPAISPLLGGEIPRKDMPVYLAASDVVVTPSRFEASPMIVKEAMAVGRRVVSTDVGDVRDLFSNLPGYEVCAPTARAVADAIERSLAVNEPSGRDRIVERGLTLEAVAQRHLRVYETLLR
jgi:glycosyltransferase involved in cell wall biosynthesis